MPRLRASLAFAVLLVPIVASGQADPALWRFVYPNAKALISIDWARIRQSQAGAMIREKWLNTGFAAAIPGIELINDIDRVLISSPGKTETGENAEAPVLIALYGHFDAAKVKQLFARESAKPQMYNSIPVYRPQGKGAKDTAFVLFDPETILFGDSKSVFAALDRNQFAPPTPAAGSILARAAEMEANYEFWVLMTNTDVMSSDRLSALFRGGEWASDAQGFEAGINLRAGLAADITVRFGSDATAKRMTAELTRVMNLAAKDKTSEPPMQDIAKKLKFSADGSATRISVRLTQQELERSAQAFAASHKAPAQVADGVVGNVADNVPGNATAAKAAALVTAPAKPAVIRIEGLDEGPREIPFPEQH
jgi:hypothetical protein